jgi:hypothetical protein
MSKPEKLLNFGEVIIDASRQDHRREVLSIFELATAQQQQVAALSYIRRLALAQFTNDCYLPQTEFDRIWDLAFQPLKKGIE